MKKYLGGLAAVVVALALSSFTLISREQERGLTAEWFHFTGDASDPDQVADPEMYVKQSPVCSSTTLAYRCDILIEPQSGNPDLPDLTQNVQQERKRSSAN